MLVHGFGCSTSWWNALVAQLAGEHPTVAFDLPGHGESPPFTDYSITAQAAAVSDAIAAHNLHDVFVAGHSMGGLVAIEVARLAHLAEPHETHLATAEGSVNAATLRRPRVRGLILIDVPSRRPHLGALGRLSLVPGVGRLARATAPRPVRRRAIAGLFAPGFRIPDELVDASKRMAPSAYGAFAEIGWYGDSAPSIAQRLAATDLPTLVIWGQHDSPAPLDTAVTFTQGAQTEFVVVPDAGHTPLVEAPAATTRTIADFITRVARESDHAPAD